jgi:hypothetical protein
MRLTFDEALEKSATGIMTRQRLSIIRNQLYGQMAHARVI